MIFYKTIDAEDILMTLASLMKSSLPEELTESDYSISLEFCDDHSVEVYLVPPQSQDETNN